MAEPLPHHQRLKLEQALAQWQHWDCEPPLDAAPTLDDSLEQGASNRVVLATAADGRHFAVRLDGIQPASHGINRRAEWRALQLAYAHGLAPRPCYFNPDLGVLAWAYLPRDETASETPAQVATLLRAIHTLPALHTRLDLGERIARYRHRATEAAPARLAQLAPSEPLVAAALQACAAAPERRVLCHNDLLAANRLHSGGRLVALDWEYCAMGSRWFDLAVVCHGDDLADSAATELLATYLERTPRREERQAVARYGLIYRYLELLWYACVAPGGFDWEARVTALQVLGQDAAALALRPG